MLGSFLGFLLESLWCVIRWRRVESRKGLLYGYFVPIYGIASLFIVLVAEWFKIEKLYMLFLVTFIICGITEYFSSLFQEKVLGTISWDYSKFKFNLNGRINLIYLLGFSFLGVLWYKFYIYVFNLCDVFFNNSLVILITIFAFIFMFLNCLISFFATYRQRKRRDGIDAKNSLEEWLDNRYTDEYLKKIYANAVIVKE